MSASKFVVFFYWGGVWTNIKLDPESAWDNLIILLSSSEEPFPHPMWSPWSGAGQPPQQAAAQVYMHGTRIHFVHSGDSALKLRVPYMWIAQMLGGKQQAEGSFVMLLGCDYMLCVGRVQLWHRNICRTAPVKLQEKQINS
jgi:hypothetical protein